MRKRTAILMIILAIGLLLLSATIIDAPRFETWEKRYVMYINAQYSK